MPRGVRTVRELVAHEQRRDANSDLAERLLAGKHRLADLERAVGVDGLELLERAAVDQSREVLVLGDRLPSGARSVRDRTTRPSA